MISEIRTCLSRLSTDEHRSADLGGSLKSCSTQYLVQRYLFSRILCAPYPGA